MDYAAIVVGKWDDRNPLLNKTIKDVEETVDGLLYTFTDGTKYEIVHYSHPDRTFASARLYKN